jgi:uncharacterized protein (DUF1501 family)
MDLTDKELEARKFSVNGTEVFLDPAKLGFNEATITAFFYEEGLFYDFYAHQLIQAEYEQQMYEIEYEAKYGDKFKAVKATGASDKLTDATVVSDPEMYQIKKKILEAKRKMRLIAMHLKSWDKTHENANNMGHTLRREMDKLSPRIYEMESGVEKLMGG